MMLFWMNNTGNLWVTGTSHLPLHTISDLIANRGLEVSFSTAKYANQYPVS